MLLPSLAGWNLEEPSLVPALLDLMGRCPGEGWRGAAKGGLGAPWGGSWLSAEGLQSRRHLTGGGGSGNAADAGRDRFAADGAEEGGPQPAGVKREGGAGENSVRRRRSGGKHPSETG